jgi:hypothetical protein
MIRRRFLSMLAAAAVWLGVTCAVLLVGAGSALACVVDGDGDCWRPNYHVQRTDGSLAAWSGPGVGQIVDWLGGDGTPVEVVCETTGAREDGKPYVVWDQLDDGTYVYGYYLDTPGDGYHPALATCPGSPGQVGGGSSCPDATGPGDNVTRWNPVVSCVLRKLGALSADNIDAVDIVISQESSGFPEATNLEDINAQHGHPSKGLVQVIQPTFDEYTCPGRPDDIWDPAANICAGMAYAIDRYGSIGNIPGVVAVRNGEPYVGYFAKVAPAGALIACGEVKASGGLQLSVSAHDIRCGQARSVATAVDNSKLLRRAVHHRGGTRKGLRIKTRLGTFSCELERSQGLGAARRAVACARRRERVSWTAIKR